VDSDDAPQVQRQRTGWWILFKVKFRKSKITYFDSTTPAPISARFAHLFGATPPVQEGSLCVAGHKKDLQIK
jgi:hypothetical protein